MDARGKTGRIATSGMTAGQHTRINFFELRQGGMPVAGVLNDITGLLALLFQGELTFLTHTQFVARPAAGSHHPCQTLFQRRINKHHRVAKLSPARFEQECRVENDRLDMGKRPGAGELAFQHFSDSGMNNLFKLYTGGLLRGGRAEHQPADVAPVDFTVGREDAGAENISNFLFDLWFLQD